ncbi:hypothetical protein CRG98_020750 [Punica granatum]|uniref:Uncharacterized protein n=1 Tax=Punica granatum TaxID=22663 RepID=A0A2I0JRJ3_PUNGR|nr:hypothetical protein CRG98_020750 [Punica granatum]
MAILNPDRTGEDTNVVENALSRAYPDLSLKDALEAERYISNASEMNERKSWKMVEANIGDEWRVNLFDCCAKPCLMKEDLSQPRLESLQNDLNYEGPIAEALGKSPSLKEELDESLAKVASLETIVEERKQKFVKADNKASQALLDNELLVERNLQLQVDELQELLNYVALNKDATALIATITKLQFEEMQWQSVEVKLIEGRCSQQMRELVHGANGGLRAMVAIIMGIGTLVTDRIPVMNDSLSGFAGGALASAIGELQKAYSDRVTMKALREIHLPRDEEEMVDLSGARRPPAPAADEFPSPWLAATL